MARSSIRKRLWAYQANCEPITVNPGLSSTWVQFQSTGNWLLKNVECRVQISRILKIFEGGYVLVATSWTITQHRVQLLSKENICSLHQQTTLKKKTSANPLGVSFLPSCFRCSILQWKGSASAPTVAERSKSPRVALKWSPKVVKTDWWHKSLP